MPGYRLLWLLGLLLIAGHAVADTCRHAGNVALTQAVSLSAEERRWLESLPPLKVAVARKTLPLADFDEATGAYHGISVDVFCFIAEELDLRYEIMPGEKRFSALMQAVQQGELDMLFPLSRQRERELWGLFTEPYFHTHYAIITRKGQPHTLKSLVGQSDQHIGVIGGSALAKELEARIPASALRMFSVSSDADKAAFYRALSDGEVDVLVHNKDIFIEDRYRAELFDLEVAQILTQFPREYGFYFSTAEPHARLVSLFDRYLAQLDVTASMLRHEVGERNLIQHYQHQQSRLYWSRIMAAAIIAAMVVVLVYFWHYRRLARKLDASHTQVIQQQQALLDANRELERLSMTDGLTGLANRRQLDQQLLHEHAVHRRSGRPLSLLILDIDHFKRVNDSLGHTTGDDYLCSVARELAGHCRRPGDLMARYGGEEFVCLLPETTQPEALLLAERMRKGVADLQLSNPGTGHGYLTISIGVATSLDHYQSEPDDTPEALLVEADARLYQAKREGRDRVCPDEPPVRTAKRTWR